MGEKEHVRLAGISAAGGDTLTVWHCEDHAWVGGRKLDLDGIGQLQVALDQAVTAIRGHQAGQAAPGA